MATTKSTRSRSAPDRRGQVLGAATLPVAGLVASVVLVVAIGILGPLVVALPFVVAAGWHLIGRPDHGLFVLVFTVTVFENDSAGLLGFTDRWYSFLPGLPVQPSDLIVISIIVGLALDYNVKRRIPRIEPWLWLPVPLLLAGTASGVVTGYLGGGDLNTLLNSFRDFALLVVVPLATAVTVDRYGLVKRLLRFWFVLVTFKCIIGVAGWFVGAGRGLGETRITYYTPTINYDSMLVILVLLGLGVRFGHRALSRAQWIGLGFAFLSLLLALRRSFWIGLALGLVLVVLVASGRRGRPWVILGGLMLVAGSALMLSAGGATNSSNPVVQRAEIRDDAEDRYRLDEQANVFGEIQRHPWTGIGLGVAWEARHPLSLEFGAGRNYTHVAVFFFWLKLGPIGVLGYFAIIVATVALGAKLWRLEAEHDPVLAAVGLGVAVGVVALAVVELTGTFTGASDRFGSAQMIVFGWLSAAVIRARAREQRLLRPAAPEVAAPPEPVGNRR